MIVMYPVNYGWIEALEDVWIEALEDVWIKAQRTSSLRLMNTPRQSLHKQITTSFRQRSSRASEGVLLQTSAAGSAW